MSGSVLRAQRGAALCNTSVFLSAQSPIQIQISLKQLTSKDLLYSTGGYAQYFVIIYKGKSSEKTIYIKYMYI